MIDIIVIMNNDLDSLIKSLASISFQTYKDIKIIIVNSTNINLNNKLNMFNDLDIKIINSMDNSKNVGMDNSKSKHLLFLNSGDLLYNCFTVKTLLSDEDKYDIITGKIGISHDDIVDFYDDMNRYTYGKFYNREFINKNHLRFNDYKYYSDMAFNKLYLMCKPREGICKREVYFTSNPISDDNSEEYIIDYCNSFKECIDTAINMKLDNKLISKTIYSNIAYLYNKYNVNYKKKFADCIFKYGKDIYNYYLKYNKYLHMKDKDKIIMDYRLDIDYKYNMEEFLELFNVKGK